MRVWERTQRTTCEHGQILIVTAASLIVLVGIAALVVDLGFSWMLHRQEQNAADPGAIAAARWLKDPLTGQPAWDQANANLDACFYAQQNGFFSGDTDCSAAILSKDLRVSAPPISGPYISRPGYVQVIITARHPAFFGRIFGNSQATIVSEAVAANTAGNSNSSSLVALQDVCSGGAAGNVNGGGTVRIFPTSPSIQGGYVHVNSPCGNSNDDICNNGSGTAALAISGTLKTPFAYVKGSCTVPGGPGFVCDPPNPSGCLDEGAPTLGDPLFGLPEPQLSSFPNGVCPSGTSSLPTDTKGCDLPPNGSAADVKCPKTAGINVCHLTPGVYYGGWQVGSKVNLELDPGMYILAGGGISLAGTSSSIEAVSSPSGIEARIMIFSTDGPGCPTIAAQCQGVVKFSASQAFQAKALNTATCGLVSPQACPWKGILLWQDGTVRSPGSAVQVGGQASTILSGTIYAPKSDVDIAGGSSTTGCGAGLSASCLSIQVISWTWKITGGALVEVPYDPAELYQLDQRGLVH
ncbi:MAG: hypothetical protein E6J50_05135 [Chloroflexi bacterium]|nr:MAG: hypothetical protein E6J50_05135 [Chloroflexota bacterium]